MLLTPDRIGVAIAAMEKGEQVDWQKLADLQALDLAQLGRRFVEEAITYNEQQTELIRTTLGGGQ